MPLPRPDLSEDLSRLDDDAFRRRLDAHGDEHGYLERLGADHSALFIDAGARLLVTFETEAEVRARPKGQPRGYEFVMAQGWSLLAIIARGDTWFRADRLYGYVDRLIDEGFFEDFDATLFFGHHAGGHAAAAYSVASPGARVLALRPVATLNPSVVRWDRRYLDRRRLDFTSRFGYAPDMLDAAGHAWIAADPSGPDGVHATLFRKPNVTVFACPQVGPRLERVWDQTGITTPLIEAAMAGTLTPQMFARHWRRRRSHPVYLRSLLKSLEVQGRFALAERLCRAGLRTDDAAFYRTRLDAIASKATAG